MTRTTTLQTKALRLRARLAPRARVIDCAGAKDALLAKLAAMRQAGPESAPASDETTLEALRTTLQRNIQDIEYRYHVRLRS